MPVNYEFFKLSLTALGAIALPAIFLDQASAVRYASALTFERNTPFIAQTTSTTATISPFASQVVINEILYQQTGAGANANDEFIEIYNPSATAIDISGWQLSDGNLINGSTDGIGSITGKSNATGYAFPSGTVLKPGEFAIVWIGNSIPSRQVQGAAFQTWLGQAPKLNNEGDDVWLYDSQLRIVDYVAYGSGSAVNTPPPESLNLWNATYQSSLANADKGQSIARASISSGSNTSACWEPSTSGVASTRCSNYFPTLDSDKTGDLVTSIAQSNLSATSTSQSTPSPTIAITPSAESTPSPTPVAEATPTPEATASPTSTPTPSPEATTSPTSAPTPSPESTSSPTPLAEATATPEATVSPTNNPETTASPTTTISRSAESTLSPAPSVEATSTTETAPSPTEKVTSSPTRATVEVSPSPELSSTPNVESSSATSALESLGNRNVEVIPNVKPTAIAQPTLTPNPQVTPSATVSNSPEPSTSASIAPATTVPNASPTPVPAANSTQVITVQPTATPSSSSTPTSESSPTLVEPVPIPSVFLPRPIAQPSSQVEAVNPSSREIDPTPPSSNTARTLPNSASPNPDTPKNWVCEIIAGSSTAEPNLTKNPATSDAQLPANVHFGFDRASISPNSAQVLNRLAAVLKQYPQIKVELSGHTDSVGNYDYNLALGKRRARAVKRYLMKQGIAANRLKIGSLGEKNLKVAGSDRKSRARNRRVYFTFLNSENLGILPVDQEEDLQAKVFDLRQAWQNITAYVPFLKQ